MKITKYEHACVTLEEQGKRLIIDPGIFTKSLSDLRNIVGVVITHAHPDHLSPDNIRKILLKNPGAAIYTTKEVAQELDGVTCQVVQPGEQVDCQDAFRLDFYGEQHATIHASYPVSANIAVFVNDIFYYAGDSFALPDKKVKVLAVPAAAPWMKISEAIDYMNTVKPKIAFPTHNAILSDIGADIYNRVLARGADTASDYRVLEPGDSLEV